MNEEENKAIESLKKHAYTINEMLSVGEALQILNLIEKLQKENEELKFKEKSRIIGKYEDVEIHDLINRTLSNDYIPIQKVKDKIKKLKEMKVDGEVFTTSVDFAILILQELIEEREGKYDIRKKGQEYYNRTTIGKFIIKK